MSTEALVLRAKELRVATLLRRPLGLERLRAFGQGATQMGFAVTVNCVANGAG